VTGVGGSLTERPWEIGWSCRTPAGAIRREQGLPQHRLPVTFERESSSSAPGAAVLAAGAGVAGSARLLKPNYLIGRWCAIMESQVVVHEGG